MSLTIWISIVGWSATILMLIANIAQTIKAVRTKVTSGLSGYTYSLLLIGTILWTIYGILTKDVPLITFNLTSFLAMATTFTIMIINRKTVKYDKIVFDESEMSELKKLIDIGYFDNEKRAFGVMKAILYLGLFDRRKSVSCGHCGNTIWFKHTRELTVVDDKPFCGLSQRKICAELYTEDKK